MYPISFLGKSVWGRAGSAAGSGLAQGSPGAKKAALAPWAAGKLSQAVTSLIVSDLADSIRRKTRNTSGLTSTTAQPFCKQFCGVSSRSVKVSDRAQYQAKWAIVSD